MDGLRAALDSADTLEKIGAVVEILVATSAKSQSEAAALSENLAEAQSQVSAMHSKLQEAEALAMHDPLTMLPNRRGLSKFLAREIARSHQDKTPLSVVMCDIDFFKKVNDRFGHSGGDAILQQFAHLLSRHTRDQDLAARYGGEEFALVLPRTPLGNATFLAEAIRKEMSAAS